MCAHGSVLRRAFEEISPSWPCNDDEVEMIRAHFLQKLQEQADQFIKSQRGETRGETLSQHSGVTAERLKPLEA